MVDVKVDVNMVDVNMVDVNMVDVNMVDINDIPVGSKFQAPKNDPCTASESDVKKAEKWWKALGNEQKVKIYQDIQDAIHNY